MDDFESYLKYIGGSTGAIALTGVAAASAYYFASRPTPEKPLVPLDNQCPILEVSKFNNSKHKFLYSTICIKRCIYNRRNCF